MMQGIILETNLKSDTGLIKGDDQVRYEFNLSACRNGLPADGATVDFDVQEGKASAIYILKTPLKAKLDWLFWFLFSFRGRISRDQLFMFLGGGLLFSFIPSFLKAGSISLGITSIMGFYIVLAVLAKRFHDSGTSMSWLIFMIVFSVLTWLIIARVLNLGTVFTYIVLTLLALLIVFCLYLCFAKGSIGSNRYGNEPYACKTVRLK